MLCVLKRNVSSRHTPKQPKHVLDINKYILGVVTVQDSQSGKSLSSILNLAKNVQKSPIKCLKEQNIDRKQSLYAYLIVNI